MTKKHFIALADALRESRPTSTWVDSPDNIQWREDCIEIAYAIGSICPRFNAVLWIGYVMGKLTAHGKPIKPTKE